MNVENFEELESVETGLSPGDNIKAGEKIIERRLHVAGFVVDYMYKYEFRGHQVAIDLIKYRVSPGNGRSKGKLYNYFLGAPYFSFIGGRVTDKAVQNGQWQSKIYGQVLNQRPGDGIIVQIEYQVDTPGGDPPKESTSFKLLD
ncbi:hypothetical protein PS662_00823 [Pseudomonas fluorescens]|uniref:Uncharacterized protein n=1 Tax=Pseudomonas fluorescens TaxID=294 RepID=A0A5E6Q565_PSEFL|nr:hypothetical protein [Pseudomonas fluorescens]VVM51356.1 hypothetical protein PS662_00823 [Pseudomonas fluorescens]